MHHVLRAIDPYSSRGWFEFDDFEAVFLVTYWAGCYPARALDQSVCRASEVEWARGG